MLFALFAMLTSNPQTLQANPQTLPAILAAAKGGETIRLSPGDYGRILINNRRFSRPIVLQAGQARLKLTLRRVQGVILMGGTSEGALGFASAGYGVWITESSNIAIYDTVFRNDTRGIVIGSSKNVEISRVTLDAMIIDGINIALSQRVTVRDSVCREFNSGEAHPDCIQMWSQPGRITSDILIQNNQVVGRGMQGITAFNHVRNGINDGGFDRIRIIGNKVAVNYPQGINLTDCRDCEISGNDVSTLPGSRWRTRIVVAGGRVIQKDNRVALKD